MTGDDEAAKVNRWLNSTGFPLEYATVRTLEASGFEVDAGRRYVSPESRVTREADVVAIPAGHEAARRLMLVCECKVLTTPWVILTRDREASALDLLSWAIATKVARDALVRRAREAIRSVGITRSGIPTWLIDTPRPHGSAIIAQPRGKDGGPPNSGPHDALLQLIGAARGLVAERPDEPALAWPVLVVRGALYEARLSDSGELEAHPVTHQRVVYGGVTGQPVVVDVVTEPYLREYAETAVGGLHATARAMDAAGLE